ncbi:MAG: DUF6326 family protein [Candidatus Nanopelagicales bacterium]|jgi:hypothetical protein|nr:DUF6326 family protein [Candidatus Nanopelagicales bacterium]
MSTQQSAPVNVRLKISAAWTAMLFVFVYVDLFSLYRADVRADIAAGEMSGFTIGQTFLLSTTLYIVVPALMVFLTLVLPAGVSRMTNIVLAVVYALTIVGAAVGEGNYYYLLGTAVEVLLLAGITYVAWTWPRVPSHSAVAEDERQHAVV